MSIRDDTALPADEYDVFDSRAARNPYARYEALRRKLPLYHDRRRDYWIVSRYADVASVLRGGDHLSNAPASFESTLLGADGDAHLRVRRIVSRLFPRIASLRAFTEETARRLVASLAANGGGDLVAEFTRPLPIAVMTHVLGLPMTDETEEWMATSISAAVTGFGSTPDEETVSTLAMFEDRMADHVRSRSRRDAQGLIGELAALSGGEAVSERELVDIARLLVVAGGETTTNLIGNMVSILMQQRDALAILLADPGLLPQYMEETLRFESPVQVTQRVARTAVEIAGGVVPEGGRIVALIGSANRDSTIFADADRFLADRQPTRHLAFGSGPHGCLGAHLSRMEAEIAMSALLPLLRSAEPVQSINEITFKSFPTRGPVRLELEFRGT